MLPSLLTPLTPFLERPDLIEITATKPGEVWIESDSFVCEKVPALTFSYWKRLVTVLANLKNQSFDLKTQPRVSTTLPGGHRFEALLGSHVEESISVAIRLKRNRYLSLADFGLTKDQQSLIESALKNHHNIMISGGTSSGKTTVLNALGRLIPLSERLITVEDTREISLPHPHQVNLLISRNEASPFVGYPEAIDHILRSRPDRVLAGEVSIPNAFPILGLLNTGHKGFMCTIHANSAALALEEAFDQKIKLAGMILPSVSPYLRKTFDLVLHVEKTSEGRKITEVVSC